MIKSRRLHVRTVKPENNGLALLWESVSREALRRSKTPVVVLRGNWPGDVLVVHATDLDYVAALRTVGDAVISA
jgi:hypothetical protein